jgi:hypothetical protein
MKERTCYRLNGGFDSNNNSFPTAFSNKHGYHSGFNLGLYLPAGNFLNYQLSENQITPTFSELGRVLEAGQLTNLYAIKVFDYKVPRPYNKCQKMPATYRMIDCLEPHLVNYILGNCHCAVNNCESEWKFGVFYESENT